jgi:hypothetical protein
MTIYFIRNTANGKWYVGKTTRSATYRWAQHVREARRPNRRGTHLHNAIVKYGPSVFSVDVLFTCNTSAELDAAEILAIFFCGLAFTADSYNCTPGGDGAPIGHTWNRGRVHTARARNNIARAHVGVSNVWSPAGKLRHAAAMQGDEYRAAQSMRMKYVWTQRKKAAQ